MKVHVVLADAGRVAIGLAGIAAPVNLLNAGWTFTTAVARPDTGYTIPSQCVAVFIEGAWNELNRPHTLVIELVDDEGHPAEFAAEPESSPAARIEQEVSIPPVPNAPNGTPGSICFLLDFPMGILRIQAPRRRYAWKVTVGSEVGEAGFWVNADAQGPKIGAPGSTT